jgi:phage tail sheath protein FI
MAEYLSPGIYMEEVDRGPKPIESVATAVAAFVGFTEKAWLEREVEDGGRVIDYLENKPKLITNWSQYVQAFGGFVIGAFLPHAVYGFFNNGGSRCYVVSVKAIGGAQAKFLGQDKQPHLLVKAKQAGFTHLRVSVASLVLLQSGDQEARSTETAAKKGKNQDITRETSVSSAEQTSPKDRSLPFTLTVERETTVEERKVNPQAWVKKEVIPDVTLVEDKDKEGKRKIKIVYKNEKPPDWIDLEIIGGDAQMANLIPVNEQVLDLKLSDEQILPATSDNFKGDVAERRGLGALEELDNVTMVCIPDLMATPEGTPLDRELVKVVQTSIIAHCEKMKDRVAILDSLPGQTPEQIKEWRNKTAGYDSKFAALYYPWIKVDDPVQHKTIFVPPCGHVAGVWARTDNTRGVHKAPANEVVLGVTDLAHNLTKGEQDTLNPDGINCIRAFPGRGIRIWGARTLSSDASWRYLNVRRLFNMIEKSIERGTQWAVFEPNDMMLWARVRRDVNSYLSNIWSDGALFGASPDQAFFVKCDEELNTPASIREGKLIIEIGISPVRPAEFVIFRISQWAGDEE